MNVELYRRVEVVKKVPFYFFYYSQWIDLKQIIYNCK